MARWNSLALKCSWGNSVKSQNRPSGRTTWVAMSGLTRGMGAVVMNTGLSVKFPRVFSTPATCPTEPPAVGANQRSVRR